MWLFKPNIKKLKSKGDIRGLIEALHYQEDPAMRWNAAVALGEVGGEVATLFLTEDLKIATDTRREASMWALGHIGGEEAVEALVVGLTDEVVAVRKAAALGLGIAGDMAAIEPLITVIRRRDRAVYEEGFQSLTRLGQMIEDMETIRERLVEPLGVILHEDRLDISDPGIATLEWMGWQRDGAYVEITGVDVEREKKRRRAAIFEVLEKVGWKPDDSIVGAAYYAMKQEWQRCVAIGPPAAEPLIAEFRDEDPEVRQAVFQSLVSIGPPAAETLIEALGHQSADIRQGVYQVLRTIGEPLLDLFIASLEHPEVLVRRNVASLLGELANLQAVVPLIVAFRDADWDVRANAYKSIVKFGRPVLAHLIQALSHPSESVQWGAAGTLEALGWKPGNDETGATYWIVKEEWHKCIAIGPPAVGPLIARFNHWDETICKRAIGSLVRIGPPALGPLVATLASETPGIRRCAAMALGLIGDKRAIAPLGSLLSDDDPGVKKVATEALKAIRSSQEKSASPEQKHAPPPDNQRKAENQ